MPVTFPSHQGLILPVVRRWPNSFDALALSVGAAMPDITDSFLGFSINGYFKQWYGHALLGIFTLDLLGGLLITSLLANLFRRLLNYRYLSPRMKAYIERLLPQSDSATGRPRADLRIWTFSMLVGILSHIGFDLISHDTNLLFYPWYENVHWLPNWWYTIWFEIQPLSIFGRTYSFGIFSIIWGLLSLIGIYFFIRFFQTDRT